MAMMVVEYAERRAGMLERPTPRLSRSSVCVAGRPKSSSASSSSNCGFQPPIVHANPEQTSGIVKPDCAAGSARLQKGHTAQLKTVILILFKTDRNFP